MSIPADLPTRPTWTREQTEAVHAMRSAFQNISIPTDSAPSLAERAAVPETGIPPELSVSPILIPPVPESEIPAVLLDGRIAPAPVPAFFITHSASAPGSQTPQSTRVIVWLHGGGNLLNHPLNPLFLPSYVRLLNGLGEGWAIFAPAYRLATVPEHTFPASIQDAFAAYAHLLKEGYQPANITLSGESSGGNTAITLAHLIAETRTIALPARIGVFTPAADASYTLSDYARAQTDVDVCPEQFLRVCAEQWLGRGPYIGAPGIGASQWRVDDPIVSASAIKHFPPDWPRTLIVCGDADVLIDGSRNVAQRIEESGGYVRFIEVPEMVHGFHVFPFFSEQATAAWGRFMDFVRE